MEVDMETGEVLEPAEPTEEPIEEPETEPNEEPAEEEPTEETEAAAVAFDAMSEGEQAKVLDKLDREAERHTKRLTEILQEDALMLRPCVLCNPRHAGWFDLSQVTEEQRAEVRIAIGDREPVKREADRYAHRCESCNGEGEVETGSKVSGQTVLPCVECSGKGWVDPSGQRATGPRVVPPLAAAPTNGTDTGLTGPTAPEMPAEVAEALATIRANGYSGFATKLPA